MLHLVVWLLQSVVLCIVGLRVVVLLRATQGRENRDAALLNAMAMMMVMNGPW